MNVLFRTLCPNNVCSKEFTLFLEIRVMKCCNSQFKEMNLPSLLLFSHFLTDTQLSWEPKHYYWLLYFSLLHNNDDTANLSFSLFTGKQQMQFRQRIYRKYLLFLFFILFTFNIYIDCLIKSSYNVPTYFLIVHGHINNGILVKQQH